MNIWNFTGNLGKDCEVRYQPSGDPICTFSVAVSSGYGDKKKTTWANCALFGKQAASTLPGYLTQGTSVAISGEVTLDEWSAQDGTKQKSLNVNVIKIDLLGSSQGKNAPNNPKQPAQRQPAQQSAPHSPPSGFDNFDDDITF
jgi:single-strand DNA-binding protein